MDRSKSFVALPTAHAFAWLGGSASAPTKVYVGEEGGVGKSRQSRFRFAGGFAAGFVRDLY